MSGMNRRGMLIGSGLLATGVLGVIGRPVVDKDAILSPGTLDRVIPSIVGAYRGVSSNDLILPEEDGLSGRVYSDLTMRHYVADRQPTVMVVAAAGAEDVQGLGVHDPAACYRWAGFEFTRRGTIDLFPGTGVTGAGQLAIAEREGRRELLLYWMRIGDQFVGDASEQRLTLIRQNLMGVQPAARLCRFSTLSSGPAADAAGFATLIRFQADLFRALSPRAVQIVLGVRA
ncbi:EpsI family protein [Sphingomonas sp. BGYR3]|uniref:exosortase C-terminal domain/associated protein EpsI n=1 Tax=Sphingomonas sp. BGYR3 TaxID=2975483 RepID=UPI0021A8DB5D|nr:exosortase C-terminal domain/associated protein EpsI [Sphingomonas sp. BGYR3]MDG5489243.1 EpsI family protein [Sphingomonas sp. BGYR3]